MVLPKLTFLLHCAPFQPYRQRLAAHMLCETWVSAALPAGTFLMLFLAWTLGENPYNSIRDEMPTRTSAGVGKHPCFLILWFLLTIKLLIFSYACRVLCDTGYSNSMHSYLCGPTPLCPKQPYVTQHCFPTPYCMLWNLKSISWRGCFISLNWLLNHMSNCSKLISPTDTKWEAWNKNKLCINTCQILCISAIERRYSRTVHMG